MTIPKRAPKKATEIHNRPNTGLKTPDNEPGRSSRPPAGEVAEWLKALPC